MAKTVILVVDRDDDFGEKGGVQTPAIGIDACLSAAAALAIADPEDSDANALYAAINIYKSMEKERVPGTFDIALICGDKAVGYLSDQALIGEFEQVMEELNPDGAILVGDGAEDEYIYPVISSRIHIDSIKKVYVKQAPGVEGTMYIIGKYLKDPEKKRRFIAPVGFAILAICAVYLVANWIVNEDLQTFFLSSTSLIITAILGMLIIFYSYDTLSYLHAKLKGLRSSVKTGLFILTVTAAALFVALAFILGIYSLDQIYTYRMSQRILVFCANALWPAFFALMTIHFGLFMTVFLSKGSVKYTSIVGCLYIVASGLIATGVLDFLLIYTSVSAADYLPVLIEIAAGIVFFAGSLFIRERLKNMASAGSRRSRWNSANGNPCTRRSAAISVSTPVPTRRR